MKPSIIQGYETSSFGRLIPVLRDTGIIKTDGLHFNATHGMSKSREYKTWFRMKSRCYDVTCQDYPDYGGRGITVCDDWINSFESFFEYMGKSPGKTHSIDRINNQGNYEPGNVRWATQTQQARNKRTNRLIKYMGESKTMAEWCEILNLPLKRTTLRFYRGHPLEIVFKDKELPKRNQRKKLQLGTKEQPADTKNNNTHLQ